MTVTDCICKLASEGLDGHTMPAVSATVTIVTAMYSILQQPALQDTLPIQLRHSSSYAHCQSGHSQHIWVACNKFSLTHGQCALAI